MLHFLEFVSSFPIGKTSNVTITIWLYVKIVSSEFANIPIIYVKLGSRQFRVFLSAQVCPNNFRGCTIAIQH